VVKDQNSILYTNFRMYSIYKPEEELRLVFRLLDFRWGIFSSTNSGSISGDRLRFVLLFCPEESASRVVICTYRTIESEK